MVPWIVENRIRFAMVAVPARAAQETLDLMILAGVRGVLNFAPITLRVPSHVEVQNVDIIREMESVVYFVNQLERSRVKEHEDTQT
jgi:redox-sensing transcriptional repressor